MPNNTCEHCGGSQPVFLYNFINLQRTRWEGADALTPGTHTLEFEFHYDGLGMGTLAYNNVSGIGRGGTGVLKVDGKEVARQPCSTPFRSSCNGTKTSISARTVVCAILCKRLAA